MGSYEKAFVARAKHFVDVGMGHSRTYDRRMACSPVRTKDLPRSGAMPLLPRPVRFAAHLRVARISDEILPSGKLRPSLLGSSFYGDMLVRIRKCTPANDLVRKSVCRSRETRRRCWPRLLSSTRSLEGMLSGTEKRFAALRRLASPPLSSPVRSAPWGVR